MFRFYKEVDKRSRKEMVNFLSNHFRYYTANPWNNSTSYACNIKIHKLGLEQEVGDKLYLMLNTTEFFDRLQYLIDDFEANNKGFWSAGTNGRSGGYLVLYRATDYKVYPGRETDMHEDFEDWSISDLRDRVTLVQEFDKLADSIIDESIYLANNFDVVEETIYKPEKIYSLMEC